MAITGAAGMLRGESYNTSAGVFNAAVSALLKEYYLPGIQDQLYNKMPLRKRLKKGSATSWDGKYWVYALHTARNAGTGYILEGGRLPDPGVQEHKTTKYSERRSYGRIKVSGPALASHSTDKGSFARILDIEMNGLVRDITFRDNRVLFGNGTGRLAQVSAVSGTTVTLINPGGVTSTGLGTQYLEQNMRVAAFTAETAGVFGSPTFRTLDGANRAATINSINYATGQIVLSGATGLTANDYLYQASDQASDTPNGSTSRGAEPNGLAAICDNEDPVFQDGAANNWPQGLGGVGSDLVPTWRASVIDNGGIPMPFTMDMLQQISDLVAQAGEGNLTAFWTTYGIRRQYLNQLVAQKRFPNTMKLDGGFETLTYDGLPIMVDKMCQKGRVYALDEDSIEYNALRDYDWMDRDGAVLHRLQDFDAYQATLFSYWQLCTPFRNRNGLITDIQDV